MGRQADASLAVLQDVVWLLPTEYAGSYMRPSVARLGGDPAVIDDLLEELRRDGVDQLAPLVARLKGAPGAAAATAEARQRRAVAETVMVFGDIPPHRVAHVLGGNRARALVQVLGQQPPAISVPAAVASLPTPTPPAPAEAIQVLRASQRGAEDVLRASLRLSLIHI
eukprot:10240823-Alexandrium_andersonii.AAC.1